MVQGNAMSSRVLGGSMGAGMPIIILFVPIDVGWKGLKLAELCILELEYNLLLSASI